jgi:hypothetical protein
MTAGLMASLAGVWAKGPAPEFAHSSLAGGSIGIKVIQPTPRPPSATATAVAIAKEKEREARLPVKLSLSVGFYDQFRNGAMVPVRITARNRSNLTLSGAVEIPDQGSAYNAVGSRAVYQQPITLAGGATKTVTLYLPSSAVGNQVNARLDANGQPLGIKSLSTSVFNSYQVTVGVLTNDPATMSWVRHLKPGPGRWITAVQLTPQTFDPMPAALGNFDVIIIADGTVGSLDSAQLAALSQYVQSGGGLVEIGGAGWQQALKPLPSDLVPGSVSSVRSLGNLDGLAAIAGGRARGTQGRALVSVLSHVQGSILSSQGGVPLAVSDPVGAGQIVYLAFDPTVNPVASWNGAESTLSDLLDDADPVAAARPPQEYYGPGGLMALGKFGYNGNNNMAAEIDNVPSPALPLIIGFVILAGVFVLLLGPLNFLLMGRIRRRGLLWLSIPLGAIVCTAATFGVAGATRNQSVLVNTLSVVTLGGPSAQRPANVYLGVFAPIPGTYRVMVPGPAYPVSVSQSTYYGRSFCMGCGSGGSTNTKQFTGAGTRFQEGAEAQIDFRKMDTWSMRNAEVATTLNVSGNIESRLQLGPHGWIEGWVRNQTHLTLVHPVVVAGRSWVSLPEMRPGQRVRVSVRPVLNIYKRQNQNNQSRTIWQRMLGNPRFDYTGNNSGAICFGKCLPINLGSNPGYPNGYMLPHIREHTFLARLRNAADLLPEAQNLTSLGQILFLAFNQQPLLPMTVNGAIPPTRNLNIIAQPLSAISIAPGQFRIRTGTFGAQLTSMEPHAPSPKPRHIYYPSGVGLGYLGSATFEFHLPDPGLLQFKHLYLNVNAGGSMTNTLRLWDWKANRWEPAGAYYPQLGYAALARPDRFVSARGTVRFQLRNTDSQLDMVFSDFNRQLQISGDGYAR